MIKELDVKDKCIVEKILDIQKASYLVEAGIIGFYDIPTLRDTLETIKESGESFYGYYLAEVLVGIISFKITEEILDIHRIAIHPNFFRKGIAEKLLNFVESLRTGISKIIVTTGKENIPAVRFYIKNGFKKVEDIEIKEGIYLTAFQKTL
ncbi:GNAT family N-acetyltransferase [Clostridium malenominatum]|uniref:GNAT family N-acetyltransferase n=1 Tax=Clostridium malenominatum TaxID=1539 RepID=A0ABP3UF27_9CLOT